MATKNAPYRAVEQKTNWGNTYNIYTPLKHTVDAAQPSDPKPPFSQHQLDVMHNWLTSHGQDALLDPNPNAWEISTVYAHFVAKNVVHADPLPGPIAGGPSLPNGIGNGLNAFSSWTDALKHFFTALFDPHLWMRIGEVIIGLVLAGVGAAKLSGATGDTLRKIPIYGKAIPA